MHVEPWMWIAFTAFILAMLAIDLLMNRDAHVVSMREAGIWSGVWVTLGLLFAGLLWIWQDGKVAGEYLAGYVIEKSLSVDNIFVFALLFSYFSVPAKYQHRVLFWGVLGALVFRILFIAGGAALLDNFHWMIYVFGGFLVITGIRMAMHKETEVHPEKNPVLKLMRRVIPISGSYDGKHFFTRVNGKRLATPLFAVLVVVETTDIIFAVDSIPAIFAITRDTFIVFTSNAFAILGLRAMYFLLAGMIRKFQYLSVGLSAVLVFVGIKMLISDVYHVPIWASLSFIAVAITASVIYSLRHPAAPAEIPHGEGLQELREDAQEMPR
ncbi:MAG TPA: TerC family protein [Actinomycetota bacterium]|nr:TerC family protein [Actinomycetota bacterium]